MFNSPRDLALDNNGVVYVADTLNNAIRMIQGNSTIFMLILFCLNDYLI